MSSFSCTKHFLFIVQGNAIILLLALLMELGHLLLLLSSCSYPLWHYIKVFSNDFGCSCEDFCTLYKLVITQCAMEYKCLNIFAFDLCFRTFNILLKVVQLFDGSFLYPTLLLLPSIFCIYIWEYKCRGKDKWKFVLKLWPFHLTSEGFPSPDYFLFVGCSKVTADFLLCDFNFHLSFQFHKCCSLGGGILTFVLNLMLVWNTVISSGGVFAPVLFCLIYMARGFEGRGTCWLLICWLFSGSVKRKFHSDFVKELVMQDHGMSDWN